MGISILIVDDDKLLVNKLEETVNWESIGISMVFTAYNIRQAQNLLEEYPIELLLCDIDMPQGNGLELLEWIRYRALDVECVFLSSYANFAYAQMALKLSSREYLLKPISNTDLEQALRKLVKIIQEKRDFYEKKPDQELQKFWENLLVQGVQEQRSLARAIEKGIYREEELISLVLIRVLENPAEETYKRDIALYNFVVHNVTAEFFQKAGKPLEAVVHQSDLEWILVFKERPTKRATRDLMKELQSYFNAGIARRFCIYLIRPEAFGRIFESRKRMEIMEKYAVPDTEGILMEEEWSFGEQTYQSVPWDAWLAEMERSESALETGEHIIDFIEEARKNNGLRTDFLQRFHHELVQMMYRYLNDQGLGFAQLFDSREFEQYERNANLSLMGSREFVHYIFEKLEGNKRSDTRQESVIEQLKSYIDLHLSEDLSRAVLAKTVYLSEDYISKVFVKMTGMSIPNYVAARRIERAKDYLKNSSLPISKIAMEVGYSNFSYFSKTFRDLVGLTPNEYRSRKRTCGGTNEASPR